MNRTLVALIGLVLLAGCSGGGGDSPSPTQDPASQAPIDPNLTVPVQTAFANFVNNGVDAPFTISGSKDDSTQANPIPPTPLTGSGRLTIGPGVTGTFTGGPFDGTAVRRTTQVLTGNVTGNSQSSPIGSTGQVYYHSNDYTILVSDFPGAYTVYDAHDFPQTVKAGDTGPLRNGRRYANFADSLKPEGPFFHPDVVTAAYAVSSDTATTLLMRIIETVRDPIIAGSDEQTQSVYRVDTAGNVSLVSITGTKSFLSSVYQTLIFTF